MLKGLRFESITNESGTWEVIILNGKRVRQGHSLSTFEWFEILESLGAEVNEREISDEDMENENY